MRMEMVQKGQMACASPCAIQQSRRSLEQRPENQGSERGGEERGGTKGEVSRRRGCKGVAA
jgi:hypothetical protein